jgi:hypothetical protein
MTGIEMPFTVYEADLRRLGLQPAQTGFVNVDRGFIPVRYTF